ncbi:MAG: M24 family metallopeptidase [Thermoplasmatota archaeon]
MTAERKAALRTAEAKAVALFDRVEELGFIAPGRLESEVNADIHALAAAEFGTSTHWHKRIVRAGANTLCPYDDNPPDLRIEDDDIVFIDLGPVFDDWEADYGRTYVLGDEPVKRRLVADAEACWTLGKAHYDATPDLTASGLFDFMGELAWARGWELGQWHSGHLVGEFPHDRPPEKVHNFVMPGNDRPMRGLDGNGHRLEWILEVHFVDRERRIGAFVEQLLTVPAA